VTGFGGLGVTHSPETNMDVEPKNRGILPPKWMVKIMEHPIKMDDLGVTIIFGNTRIDIALEHSKCLELKIFISGFGASLGPIL